MMGDALCSVCGNPVSGLCIVTKSVNNRLVNAWQLCEECGDSLSEWALSRGKRTSPDEEPPRVGPKRCPFSRGGDFASYCGEHGEKVIAYPVNACTSDCAVYFGGKCALTSIAEAMN